VGFDNIWELLIPLALLTRRRANNKINIKVIKINTLKSRLITYFKFELVNAGGVILNDGNCCAFCMPQYPGGICAEELLLLNI